jgi:hypothetical protein
MKVSVDSVTPTAKGWMAYEQDPISRLRPYGTPAVEASNVVR